MTWNARRRAFLVRTRTALEPPDALERVETTFRAQGLAHSDVTPVSADGFLTLGLAMCDGFFGNCLVTALVAFERGPAGDALHLVVSSHHPPAAASLVLAWCDATSPGGAALAVLPARKRRLLERISRSSATSTAPPFRSPLTRDPAGDTRVAIIRADGCLGLLAVGSTYIEWVAEAKAWEGFLQDRLPRDRVDQVALRANYYDDDRTDWRITLRTTEGEDLPMDLMTAASPELFRRLGMDPEAPIDAPEEPASG